MAFLVTICFYCITILLEKLLTTVVTFLGKLSHSSCILYFA